MVKLIRYKTAEGETRDLIPVPNARLIILDGAKVPLYLIVRNGEQEKPEGIEWAETEEEFLDRIAAKGLPAGARQIEIVSP